MVNQEELVQIKCLCVFPSERSFTTTGRRREAKREATQLECCSLELEAKIFSFIPDVLGLHSKRPLGRASSYNRPRRGERASGMETLHFELFPWGEIC